MARTILVVGSGFAGLWAALAAARVLDQHSVMDVEVALVSPQPQLALRPRLHEGDPAAWSTDISPHLQAAGIRYIQGAVQRVHRQDSHVELAGADGAIQSVAYDRLVLAAGSAMHRPAIPGLEQYAYSIDQAADAAELDAHLKTLAARPDTPSRNTFVIAGAGFTGIELACELPGRLQTMLPGVQPRIVLVEQEAAVGPDLGGGPRPVIEQALDSLGIERLLGQAVTALDAGGVVLANGERIASATVIWTGGMRASALAAQVAAATDALGRAVVDADLRVPGGGGIFAAGDAAAAITDDDGHHTLMACQHALVTGRYAGHNAACDLLGLPTQLYRQPVYVTCLDLGGWGAVFTQGWQRDVAMAGADAKDLKIKINTQWIYPPAPQRAQLLAAADPEQAFKG
ncbi:NAD(P)/FAD-dependent oxidoreductase [Pseudoduganella ginsengisoli]|uniref:NAD(P)/FAD-dependent oxidoreductase n=1 Tax=Pseudoduganella ginsengisoli TaxID=1462440 RepID=A0A6L6Q4N9_9BURK|nr:FAD-dependent oxidoreductase [Pseudoduganella ginsengisoli]MTW04218.1 NAD(P)/FAD-dependent oxidoreductase [Pseudoduganella ginsengisoli]